MAFEFTCAICGQVHRGMPSFGADAPLSYYDVPLQERERRCRLGTDDCVIDDQWFFVCGCIDIPVHGEKEQFTWSVWVSLSEKSFTTWSACFDAKHQTHIGPFFGWLNTWLKPYPDTANLKTRVHLRDDGIRPYIELEPTMHPLAIEQREGISRARLAEIYALAIHDEEA
jgi:hypothetical protein